MPATRSPLHITASMAANLLTKSYDFLLVTGSPRSGTRYCALFLHQLFYEGQLPADEKALGHELMGARDTFDITLTDLLYEVNWCLAPSLRDMNEPSVLTALLVRHPLDTITSIHRRGFLEQDTAYGELARFHVPFHRSACHSSVDILRGATYWWLKWMELALEGQPHILFKIEDLTAEQEALAKWCGWQNLPTNVNTGGKFEERDRLEGLKQLRDTGLRREVREMGWRLGYSDLD